MLTSDPIYNKPYKAAIYINNTGNSTNYYTYDPWTDTGDVNKPIHLALNLSENTHGKFVCQIEDGGRTLNRNNINKGARFIVKVGKYSTGMTQVLSGLVREVADSRGGDRKDIYTLSGSTTSIRNNERIIYYVKQAAKLLTGEIDATDANMQAVKLLVAAYGGTYSIQPNYGSEDGFGLVNINNTTANSIVTNFIADVNIEFGEIQDAINLIEEQSGSEYIVSSLDAGNLRYELRTPSGGRGFTIKNKTYRITGIDDDADDTMYLIRKNWKYSDSVYKSDSYANRISGILAPQNQDPPLMISSSFVRNIGSSVTLKEWAVKFKPNHSRWLPGDIFVLGSMWIDMDSTFNDHAEPGWRFRVINDNSNSPNSASVIANIDFPAGAFPNEDGTTGPPTRNWVNSQFFYDTSDNPISEFKLDTTKYYWLILSSENAVSGNSAYEKSMRWGLANVTNIVSNHQSDSGSMSTDSSSGSGWLTPGNSNLGVYFPRIRSQSIVMHDPKAIKNLGSGLATGGTPIEAHLPAFPSIIKTREAGFSYAANQLYYMAKPRANYSIPAVTAPNICPLPGDPIVIMDTVLGFSTAGNKVIFTRCGDMSLSWGSLDGSGFTYDAPTKLNINPVGNIPRYI
jgi:hypothetical protein